MVKLCVTLHGSLSSLPLPTFWPSCLSGGGEVTLSSSRDWRYCLQFEKLGLDWVMTSHNIANVQQVDTINATAQIIDSNWSVYIGCEKRGKYCIIVNPTRHNWIPVVMLRLIGSSPNFIDCVKFEENLGKRENTELRGNIFQWRETENFNIMWGEKHHVLCVLS